MNIYFIDYNLLLSFIHLLQLPQLLALGPPSDWLLCPFNMPPHCFEHSLPGIRRCSRFILYFTCSSPDSFYWRAGFRNQDVGTSCACCYLVSDKAKEHVSICYHVHIHRHLYFIIYPPVYVKPRVHPNTSTNTRAFLLPYWYLLGQSRYHIK